MKKIIVVPRREFVEAYNATCTSGENWAYISIENTGEPHAVHDPRVLNVDFDDVSDGPGVITPECARSIYEFARDHCEDNILVHCTAGVSRSQGVARALWDCFPEYWKPCDENRKNPCVTPNITVCAAIKRAHYTQIWNVEE